MADFAPMCNAGRRMEHGPVNPGGAWRPDEVASALLEGLRRAGERLDGEQAVHGPDALDERGLHAILAEGLASAGWGVAREAPYPGDVERGDRERDRCDLVVLPGPGLTLLDPVHGRRRVEGGAGTLFASVAEAMEAEAALGAVAPDEALWLEVKAIAQHTRRHGIPVPNRAYAGELVRGPAEDIAKLAFDGVITHAASVVVLFTETEDIARHDLLEMTARLLDRDLPVSTPSTALAPITERMGNACVAVAVLPLRGLGLG